MSKQTSVELPNPHAENPVGQSVAGKRKRGRPAKLTTAKLDETVETASTSAEHSCGKSYAAKPGRHTKPMLTATTAAKAVTLEELQKGDGGWFTIKPAVTIAALCRDRYSYHRCVECRLRALPNAEGKFGCAQHPEAVTEEIYRLRVLLGKTILIYGHRFRRCRRADYGCFCERVPCFRRRGTEESRLGGTRNEL